MGSSWLWFVKEIAKYVLQPLVLPIREGPLKGKKWIVASGIKFFRGVYEPQKTAVIQQAIKEGDVVYDIGAHVGYYTVLASMLVGPRGRVIAFEPRPLNVIYLKKHLTLNRCTNVRVIEACVADRSGECRFETRCGTGTGHISSEGNLSVRMVSLDDLFKAGEIPPPNFIKIDVEGAEFLVLKGAQRLISDFRPTILVETHRDGLRRQCLEFLAMLGYQFQPIFKGEILCVPERERETNRTK